ncbi:hypothetical protein [Actinomadura roseirufa]|nr:hypothetical protein [Actinomadura roseirufa]
MITGSAGRADAVAMVPTSLDVGPGMAVLEVGTGTGETPRRGAPR